MASFSGVSASVILQHNLDLPTRYFWKELLRLLGKLLSIGLTLFRDRQKETGDGPDYSAELTWLHSFTPAINHYIRKELKIKTDIKYNMFGPVRPWNNENDNTRDNLRQAMAQNPYLKVMTQSGYYDGATTILRRNFRNGKWTLVGNYATVFRLKVTGGHMMSEKS